MIVHFSHYSDNFIKRVTVCECNWKAIHCSRITNGYTSYEADGVPHWISHRGL